MWEPIFRFAAIGLYIGILIAVAFYGFHRYVLVYLYVKHRNKCYQPKLHFDELPYITVQLPMYNEAHVAERIIRASCRLDYPLDRLEIQVLDDSTDESADIARRACEEWQSRGYPVRYLHRDNRVGYKAGALAEGLNQAKGEYIAIFDADFVPPRDILRNVVNYFTDEKIGMVQVRWDHLNRDASLLTRSQAILLDGHFVIEHTARNRSGRFMNFNGTAGIWRRTTIDDAGGWQHDTLTEDTDLSYRAQMKGWQFVYLPQYTVPAELPPEIIAFKQQSHRWTKGLVQTGIKLLPGILRAKQLSLKIKMEAFFHLTNMFVYPLVMLLTLLMYPTFFNNLWIFEHDSVSQYLFSASLFVIATCSASTFFVFGQKELFGAEGGWRTLLHLPFLMSLGVGMCINNTKAVIEAIWSAFNRKPSEFVRTPKYGVTGVARQQWRRESMFTLKRLSLPIIEIAFGCYMSACIYISLSMFYWSEQQNWSALATVPFLLIFAGGYFYVGFGSIYALYQMNREAQADVEVAST